jgi:twitching motility two-component system response regulator PilG
MPDSQIGATQIHADPREQSRLRAAARLAQEGKMDAARDAFEQICTDNNDCEAGWLWLASLVEDAATGLDCLREVLRVNPNNKTALAWLAKSERPVAEPRKHPKCPLCGTWWPELLPQCHSCHALFDLTNVEAFAANNKLNRDLMETALERLSEKRGAPFEREYYQGVALLNLMRSYDALPHLTKAAQIKPTDPRIHNDILKRWTRRPSVVVADGSMTSRESTALIMEETGLMAVPAASAKEALALIRQIKPSLALIDVNLPGADGYHVCKTLRSDKATSSVPVILISTTDGVFDRAKGKMAGASGYVAKPFQTTELAVLARTYLRKKP